MCTKKLLIFECAVHHCPTIQCKIMEIKHSIILQYGIGKQLETPCQVVLKENLGQNNVKVCSTTHPPLITLMEMVSCSSQDVASTTSLRTSVLLPHIPGRSKIYIYTKGEQKKEQIIKILQCCSCQQALYLPTHRCEVCLSCQRAFSCSLCKLSASVWNKSSKAETCFNFFK